MIILKKNKEIHEIGCKYFGFQNYDNENRVHWLYEDAKNCLEKMAKFNEKNNINNNNNSNKSNKLS